ncbi:MAG: B12-binding domain-containing radical SAM protein [Desulfatibacillaceae bacterium]
MKVLMLYVATEGVNMPVLPLGMACVASAAEKHGHEVRSVIVGEDAVEARVSDAVEDFGPEVVGLSARNIDDQCRENPRFLVEPVRLAVAACRRNTNAVLVLGGAGYSMFPQALLDYTGADMGVAGEGERAFCGILDSLAQSRSPEGMPGVHLPGRPPGTALASDPETLLAPPPAPGRHVTVPSHWNPADVWVPIQSRRGCPMGCVYCSTGNIEGRILRKRPVRDVVENLSAFADAGLRQFFFVDNTFNFPPTYAKAMCDAIAGSGLDIAWRAIIYPKGVDEDLVERMAAAGCAGVSLGFESGCQATLDAYGKKFTPADVVRIANLFRKHGMFPMGFLMLGGPGETPETVRRSMEFVESLGLGMMKVTQGVRIYPDTPLAEIARREGVIVPDDDLLHPRFYIRPGMETCVEESLAQWKRDHPEWFR